MSGGHFNYNGYAYYKVEQFADELEHEIINNDVEDKWGYAPSHPPEVIEYLKKQVLKMRKMAEIMKRIDYLYSGDHGDDSFMKKVNQIDEDYD